MFVFLILTVLLTTHNVVDCAPTDSESSDDLTGVVYYDEASEDAAPETTDVNPDDIIDPELAKKVTENTINQKNTAKGVSGDTSVCEAGSDVVCRPKLLTMIRDKRKRWLGQNVRYHITNYEFTANQISIIEQAMNQIQAASCVRFQEIDEPQPDSVVFKKEVGCSGTVGRALNGRDFQKVFLEDDCFGYGTGILVHEILHTLGFYHEQMRTDRDENIRVVWNNIDQSMHHNFGVISAKEMDLMDLPYDYDSIMHYGAGDFAITPGLTTIQPLRPYSGYLGQRERMSELDRVKLNVAYECANSRPNQQPQYNSPSNNDRNGYYESYRPPQQQYYSALPMPPARQNWSNTED